ncbi:MULTISPECIES: hypothetical protein [Metabacillus]|uniref:hypothetical protein n=1 Tax=Metabacillus TaxID=2675233 RepID=UPI001111388B|nr:MULTISPECIES: hypothetical protein [Metabacillus]
MSMISCEQSIVGGNRLGVEVKFMSKLSGEFEKFMDNHFGRHDDIQTKHSKWMGQKEKDLGALERTADAFEKRMEQLANDAERWMSDQEKRLKK